MMRSFSISLLNGGITFIYLPGEWLKEGHGKLDWAHGFCDTDIVEAVCCVMLNSCSFKDSLWSEKASLISFEFMFAWKTMLLIRFTKRGKFRSNPCHLVECEQHQLQQRNIFLFLSLVIMIQMILKHMICNCVVMVL